MIRFFLKGLLRDRNRSLFPIIIVFLGVMITVMTYCYLRGAFDGFIRSNARLETGHMKIMTSAYAEIANQVPNDLALSGVENLLADLRGRYPEIDWAPRIKFGGLIDFPDDQGETRAQGPVFGIAVDLLDTGEAERLKLGESLVSGRLPEAPGEMLLSHQYAAGLGVNLGETATLIGSTAHGSMAVHNFTLVGTLRFGIAPMDRNAMIAQLSDVQYALDMNDGAGEILGFLPNMIYDHAATDRIAAEFNAGYGDNQDQFSPVMLPLADQSGLREYLEMVDYYLYILVFVFVSVMSIVLWNAGLMSGIRRYGEMGIRLAMGESKGHVYRSLISESILIGIAGSIIGTIIGLAFSYYLQEVGIDITSMMEGMNMMMSNVLRSRVTPTAFYLGFLPGLLATVIGSSISGIGMLKRQTSTLFKELEA